MKLRYLTLILLLLTGCKKDDNVQPTEEEFETLMQDCIPGSVGCEEIFVINDPYAETPTGHENYEFWGHADPSIRKDPNSNDIWLAYSHPHYKHVSGNIYAPSVSIHLARSTDQGDSWIFVKKLWEPVPMNDPANTSNAGFLDHETVNLLPVAEGNETVWYAARLNYFIPEQGGFNARPPNSYHIIVLKANSPENLSSASFSRIGSTLTDETWQASSLIPSDLINDAFFWNEPSLYYENGRLYLIMVAFVYFQGEPVFPKNNVYVYSTTPVGEPADWVWDYNGKLVDENIAAELGGLRLTQTDIARSTDGKLLLIATPDDWVESQKDFNHKGCVVVQVKSLENPELERDKNGELIIHAKITVSDANQFGSGASAYDSASTTGLIITRREKTDSELTASIWKTSIRP